MEELRIFGARVRASIVVDLIRWEFADRIHVTGFYDDRFPVGSEGPGGSPVLGSVAEGIDAVSKSGCSAFLALGTKASAAGYRVFLELQSRGVQLVNLVSAEAHIAPSARLGDNALVLPGVFVGCEVRVGHMFCAHGGSVVEHHSRVGDNVLLASGVSVAGAVDIGDHCFIGTGCSSRNTR